MRNLTRPNSADDVASSPESVRECIHKPEQPKAAENGGGAIMLSSRGWDCGWKKYRGGEEWLQGERCAKLIWQCRLLLRGVALRMQSHITAPHCTLYYETHKQKKSYKCLILRSGEKGTLWKSSSFSFFFLANWGRFLNYYPVIVIYVYSNTG